jgi:hypothetical protein
MAPAASKRLPRLRERYGLVFMELLPGFLFANEIGLSALPPDIHFFPD